MKQVPEASNIDMRIVTMDGEATWNRSLKCTETKQEIDQVTQERRKQGMKLSQVKQELLELFHQACPDFTDASLSIRHHPAPRNSPQPFPFAWPGLEEERIAHDLHRICRGQDHQEADSHWLSPNYSLGAVFAMIHMFLFCFQSALPFAGNFDSFQTVCPHQTVEGGIRMVSV